MSPSILDTGGTRFIGSHTVVELVNSGRHVVVLHDLSKSLPSVVDGLCQICGDRFSFLEADVRTPAALDRVFQEHAIVGEVHFACSKAVGESVHNTSHCFETTWVAPWSCFRTWSVRAYAGWCSVLLRLSMAHRSRYRFLRLRHFRHSIRTGRPRWRVKACSSAFRPPTHDGPSPRFGISTRWAFMSVASWEATSLVHQTT
jgi:GDP-mannose 4,6 dehydratase